MIDPALKNVKILAVDIKDVRFRFHEGGPGSDANNPHTDYSNPYVELITNTPLRGVGIGFSLGKGNEHICSAAEELFPLIKGISLYEIIANFSHVWRKLANPIQSRWIGPNCGPYHMAAGALANAVFDLYAKFLNKPLWEVLLQLEPIELIEMIDFRYVEHLLNKSEALLLLEQNRSGIDDRKKKLELDGLPAYFTTWIGSSVEDLIAQISDVRQKNGIRLFKMKVGVDLDVDLKRIEAVRKHFGSTIDLCVDANQVWSPPVAVEWVTALSKYDLTWIEEPTAPDSISGHKWIRDRIKALNIDVVTGENCPNSHVAAQMMECGAIDRFQIDACRVIGPMENILIMLVARKYGIPVCPHAGGSGLDELVPHLAAWNYIALGAPLDKVRVEQVNFCSQYFIQPSRVVNGKIPLPSMPGYIVGMKEDAIMNFHYPDGTLWRHS